MAAKFLAEMLGTMIILMFGTGVVANVVFLYKIVYMG